MQTRRLMKGNEGVVEGAIAAGCDAYFGYPITPASEILELMSSRMPALNRVFVQAESEIAAINMVLGAAASGFRVMTASAGPGMSLKQEGISYLAGSELPCVIVDMMRGGPGLGSIQPAQGDYFQATKGGGHGDYHMLVLAPASVQEAYELTALAFDLADTYRNPVMILADGAIAQMMEPVDLAPVISHPTAKPWAASAAPHRPRNKVASLRLNPLDLEHHNQHLQAKYAEMAAREVRFVTEFLDDAQFVVVAFGISGRIAESAVHAARQEGIAAGLLRPISLWPFPSAPLVTLSRRMAGFLVVELNAGQMVQDVALAVQERAPIQFYGRTGGILPTPTEILDQIRQMAGRRPQVHGAGVYVGIRVGGTS